MTRLGLQHHDGPLARLEAGSWTLDAAGRVKPLVFIACPECAAAYDIDPLTVDARGEVAEEFFCQTPRCTVARFLRLENWTAQRFDNSEGEP